MHRTNISVAMTIIEEIKKAADKSGVTPEKLLESAGIHRTQWRRWKSGTFEPRAASKRAVEAAIERLAEGEVE